MKLSVSALWCNWQNQLAVAAESGTGRLYIYTVKEMGVQVLLNSPFSPEIAVADPLGASLPRDHPSRQFLPRHLSAAILGLPRLSVSLRVQHAGNGV